MTDFLGTESDKLRIILSNNIRMFRQNLHLTQELLAENADISLSYLADIEHCKTWISDKTLIKLAKSLHKQPYELLMESNNVESSKTDIQAVSEIISDEKKEIIKAVSLICDKTVQRILKV